MHDRQNAEPGTGAHCFNCKESIGFSAHGFRATASTVLNEMGYRADVIERQLAYAERNKVRVSYIQAKYLEERRRMMQAWADEVDVKPFEKKIYLVIVCLPDCVL